MSFSFGNILPATNGLVFYLDAGNQKSYNRIDTDYSRDIWRDIAGDGSAGVLTNGPSFNSGNGGYISFDGNNDVAIGTTSPNSLLNVGVSGSVTIEIVTRVNTIPTSTSPCLFNYGTNNNLNYGSYAITVSKTLTFGVGSDLSEFTNTGYSIALNRWHHGVFIFSSSNKSVYINGVSKSAHTINTSNKLSNNWNIASYGATLGADIYLHCDVGLIRIYNRELSASEVLNNYNFSKIRFGF